MRRIRFLRRAALLLAASASLCGGLAALAPSSALANGIVTPGNGYELTYPSGTDRLYIGASRVYPEPGNSSQTVGLRVSLLKWNASTNGWAGVGHDGFVTGTATSSGVLLPGNGFTLNSYGAGYYRILLQVYWWHNGAWSSPTQSVPTSYENYYWNGSTWIDLGSESYATL